jgi:hypothetical protein
MISALVASTPFLQKFRGCIYILAVYGAMYSANLVFSRSDFDAAAIFSNLMISVIIIIALFGLTHNDYKPYE